LAIAARERSFRAAERGGRQLDQLADLAHIRARRRPLHR
jgi:hypothetical protein